MIRDVSSHGRAGQVDRLKRLRLRLEGVGDIVILERRKTKQNAQSRILDNKIYHTRRVRRAKWFGVHKTSLSNVCGNDS